MLHDSLEIAVSAIELKHKVIKQFKNQPKLMKALATATHVDIQSVANYFWMDSDREVWDPASDVTSIRSPWNCAWMTFRIPPYSNSNGNIVRRPQNTRPTVGILMSETKDKNGIVYVSYVVFVDWPHVSPEILLFELQAKLNENGNLDENTDEPQYFRVLPGLSTELCNTHPVMRGQVFIYRTVAMLACAFANCKNVKQDTVEYKPHSKKVRQRLGDIKHTYRVLRITKISGDDHSAGDNADEIKKGVAYHICRGHFADYREGKGLFGKYHGRFWIPQHVKGNQKHGSVTKDYTIL